MTRIATLLLASASVAWIAAAATESEDAAVLQAVLEHHCQSGDGTYFVLNSETHELSEFETAPLPNANSAVNDLLRRNMQSANLPADLSCSGIRPASPAQITAALAEHPADPNRFHLGWEGFYAAFPNATGLLSLSLPGYARNGRSAVVLSSAASGIRFSSGFLVTLKKTPAGWKVVRSRPLWVS